MKKVMLHDLTRPAFEEYLRENPDPVVIIALGSIEQHGPHLPLGTDSYGALAVARQVAEATGCLVVQPCWPGFSPHHMGFKGTITLKAETLVAVLLDTIESLAHHGIKKILLINAHGGNAQIVAYVARLARRRFGSVVIVPDTRGLQDPQKQAEAFLERMDVHSGPRETSFALAFFPELVEMERVKGFQSTTRLRAPLEELRKARGEEAVLAAQLLSAYIPDSHLLTSSGVWGFADPNEADPEKLKEEMAKGVEKLIKLVELWKKIPSD